MMFCAGTQTLTKTKGCGIFKSSCQRGLERFTHAHWRGNLKRGWVLGTQSASSSKTSNVELSCDWQSSFKICTPTNWKQRLKWICKQPCSHWHCSQQPKHGKFQVSIEDWIRKKSFSSPYTHTQREREKERERERERERKRERNAIHH